jgi:sugar (pentulose or hexulose) kinase
MTPTWSSKGKRQASKLTGLRPEALIVAGGGDGQAAGLGVNALSTESSYLNLGTADVTGKSICLPKNTEASALGAAIAAAVGAGWYVSFREAANAITGIRKKIKPDSDNSKKYQELFPIYRRLCPCLKRATVPKA